MRHAISACRFFYKMQSSRLQNLFLQWRAARVWVSSLHNNRVLLSASPKVEQKSKNWEKCSTAASKICARVSGSRTKKQKLGKMFYRATSKTARTCQLSYWEVLKKSACTRPVFTAPYPNAASHHRCIQKHWILQKKEPPKIGRFLRCAAFIFFSVIRS